VPAGHHLSLGVMWQYGDERSVASTRTMSVPYGVCCSSACVVQLLKDTLARFIARKKVAN
jgi:hypothetical protein